MRRRMGVRCGMPPDGILRTMCLCMGLLIAPVAASAQSGRTLLREGNNRYEQAQYPDAEISYRKALESPDGPAAAKFNLGDALFKQGRYDEAATQFEDAASAAENRNDRAGAYHNLGNALLKGKKYEESIGAYKEALKLNPKDEDTRYNLEYAKRFLQRQQQQQQQQDQKDNKDQQQKQDKQKKDQQDRQQRKQDQQQQDRQNKGEKQPPRQPKDQISKADAERILEALKQQEQDVKKKLQKKVPVRVKTEKDW